MATFFMLPWTHWLCQKVPTVRKVHIIERLIVGMNRILIHGCLQFHCSRELIKLKLGVTILTSLIKHYIDSSRLL